MLPIDYGLIGLTGLLIYEGIDLGLNKLPKLNLFPKNSTISQYDVLVGHNKKNKIVVNMKNTPHLLVCGLSGQGKSRCIEYAMRDKLNITLINAFEDDFKSINCERIYGCEEIQNYLVRLLQDKHYFKIPKFIVIDEMIVLCADKKISKAIIDLLSIGRHYNIFIIGIAQRGLKTDLPFKDLFNARMTFRQVENSSYRSILGGLPDDINIDLNPRQFIIYHTKVESGYTYDI